MAIDKQLIHTMLDNLKSELRKIEHMDVVLDAILGNEDMQDMLDRRMQVAIEQCIDIATHMAAGLDLPRKERAADVFMLLSEHNVIAKEVAKKLVGASGLRNILVHEYAAIDYRLAYKDLSDKIEDLQTFAKEVLAFVEKVH